MRGRGRGNFRRGRGNSRSGSRKFQTKAAARRENNGKFFKVIRVPPTIVDNPWNHCVLPTRGTNCTCLTSGGIITNLKAYLNISTFVSTYNLSVRFVRCKVWVEKTDTHPLSKNASVRFFSLIGEQFISEQNLYPGDVSFMSTGYEWPRSQQIAVFYAGGTNNIMSIVPEDTAAEWSIQLHLLWRIEKPCACPGLEHLINCKYKINCELFGNDDNSIITLEERIAHLEDKFKRFDCNWEDLDQ